MPIKSFVKGLFRFVEMVTVMRFLNSFSTRLSQSKQLLYCCILFFGLFSVSSLYSQQLITKSFSEIATLPDDEFYDVLQDSKGNYWFAADTGLYRFDGIQFIHYTNEVQKGQSLFNLKEDNAGRIWCNSLSGQFFYIDPIQDRLDFFIDVSDDFAGGLPIYELYKEYLLVKLDNSKLFQYNVNTKEKSILTTDIATSSSLIRKNNYLYFFDPHYLTDFNIKDKSSKKLPESFKGKIPKLYLLNNQMYILCTDKNYQVTELYTIKKSKIIPYTLPKEILGLHVSLQRKVDY